jgi:hypothetical protein
MNDKSNKSYNSSFTICHSSFTIPLVDYFLKKSSKILRGCIFQKSRKCKTIFQGEVFLIS